MLCTGVSNKCLYQELLYFYFLGLQPRDKAAVLVVNTKQFFSRTIYLKVEVSFQRREMLLFLATNIAVVKSRANQQLEEPVVTLATIGPRGRCRKGRERWEKGFQAEAGIGIYH